MKLDALLNAHAFMHVERPPLLWEADAEDEPLIRVLGLMIVFALERSKEVSDLTLNAANVEIPAEGARAHVAAGGYVALTVRGPGADTPEIEWWPGAATTFDMFGELTAAALKAGVVYVYSRNLGEEGSITALWPRTRS